MRPGHMSRVENEFRLDSSDFGFICDGISNVDSHKKLKKKSLI